jgi:hypothetical protein
VIKLDQVDVDIVEPLEQRLDERFAKSSFPASVPTVANHDNARIFLVDEIEKTCLHYYFLSAVGTDLASFRPQKRKHQELLQRDRNHAHGDFACGHRIPSEVWLR